MLCLIYWFVLRYIVANIFEKISLTFSDRFYVANLVIIKDLIRILFYLVLASCNLSILELFVKPSD